jgi:hypothetical protein
MAESPMLSLKKKTLLNLSLGKDNAWRMPMKKMKLYGLVWLATGGDKKFVSFFCQGVTLNVTL